MTVRPQLALRSPALRAAPSWDDPFWYEIETTLHFTIIGAAKSGTSWLYGLLRQHPRLFIPNEQNFFTTYRHLGVERYDGLYQGQAPDVLLGDYSTSYMLDAALPEALARRFPGIKVIIVCRDPVDRAYSHYLMDIRNGDLEPGTSFAAALADPPQFSYFSFGLYMDHIGRWLEHVDRDDVLVVLFDDLIPDPVAVTQRVFGFLGVDPSFAVDVEASNRNEAATQRFHNSALVQRVRRALVPRMSDRVRRIVEPVYFRGLRWAFARNAPTRPEMPAATRVVLAAAYQSPNENLARFLGRDLSHWSE